MTDKEAREQKKRVKKVIDKWFKTMGMNWWRIDMYWERDYDAADDRTAARTSWSWQYRSAVITWFLPVIQNFNDEELENAVVHEFSHILIGAVSQDVLEDKRQLVEYSTENVTRAIIWAREAGEKK